MTDHQILAQAETWRMSASEARRECIDRIGSCTRDIELHAQTLEQCAARLESLVKHYPSQVAPKTTIEAIYQIGKSLGYTVKADNQAGGRFILTKGHR